MSKNPVKINLLLGFCFFCITGILFGFQYMNTKRKIQEFNTLLGKNEGIGFGEVFQTLSKDNTMGTFDENVRFLNVQYKTGVIEIKEKMFLAQTNDIYLNSEDYLGKTIKLEGLFKIEDFPWQERPFYYVLRYGPGCCGFDGSAGFEVMWDGKGMPKQAYPQENDWVMAVGTLKSFNNDSIYIALTAITVLDKRGAELVRQ
jgi:uncharacterized membrane protein YcgQ (UPF0703/DUF1980 family)